VIAVRNDRAVRIASEPVFETQWLRVLKNRYLFARTGEEVEYFITDAADIALVIPMTKRGRFVMVEQYKPAVEARSLEFPAGHIDGRSALSEARRELLEETGYVAERWRRLGIAFADSGRSRNRIHVFLARGAARAREPQPDPVERLCGLTMREVSRGELRSMAADGRIRSSATLAAFAMLMARGSFQGPGRKAITDRFVPG
jgi:ADP-ribose pyrophosphatase